jgi:hypothetical protein
MVRSVTRSRPRADFLWPSMARSTHATRFHVPSEGASSVFGVALPFRTSQSFQLLAPFPIPAEETYHCRLSDGFHSPPLSK